MVYLSARHNRSDPPHWLWVASFVSYGVIWGAFGTILWHPQLEIIYSHTFPYCEDEPYIDLDLREAVSAAYYFRAAVRNRGSARAEKVEVLAIDLHRIVDGKPPEFIRRYSSNLTWSSNGQALLDGLSPGVDRFVTLGKVLHPNGRKKIKGEHSDAFFGAIAFSMEMPARGTTLAHLLPPGAYELGLMVVAANRRPARYVVRLNLGPDWRDDIDEMLRESVKLDIRPARRLRF